MSTQTKAAKEALDAAVLEYKRCSVLTKKYLAATPLNKRTVNSKMKMLSEAVTNLNKLHTSWVTKAGFSDEQLAAENYSSTWLESEWEAMDEIQNQVEAALSEDLPTQRSEAQKLEICMKQMETLKLDIDSKTTNLTTELAAPTINSASLKLINDMLQDVKSSLNTDFTGLSKDIMSLDHTNVVNRCQEFEEFRRTQLSKVDTIGFQLAKKTPTPSSAPSSAPVPLIKTMEMEKSKAPVFSGKTIDYPEFKRGWLKVAGVCWSDGNQVEQIKQKVDLDSRRIISRCDTMEDVWKVLDGEYAQEGEVINAVDVELKALRMSKCSVSEYIVKLRNHLPNLEEALKSVNGLDHLCSPARVDYLSAKFDDRTLYDWDYFRSKQSDGTTYERFFKFLVDRYDAAKSSIARSTKVKMDECTQVSPDQQIVNLTSAAETECRRCRTFIARDTVYTCPGCGRGTPVGQHILHCLEHCGAYMRMSANERSTCVEAAKWCPVHLLGTHSYTECNNAGDQKFLCGVDGCDKHHHKTLHGSSSTFVANIHATQCDDESEASNVLFSIQSIPSAKGKVMNGMFDNCATCSLISKSAAHRLQLEGKAANLFINTVTGGKVVKSCSYAVPLFDKNKKCHHVTAYEIESISDNISENDISGVKHLFSAETQSLWDLIKNRPTGEIDVLIGSNVLGIHPRDMECKGNLRVKSSLFGSGYVISGSHPSIKSKNFNWNEDVSAIRHVVNRVTVQPTYDYFDYENEVQPPKVCDKCLTCQVCGNGRGTSTHTVNQLTAKSSYSNLGHDNLGIQPPRRCKSCQNCKECSFRGHMLSQQDQYEYQVLESKVEYDPNSQSFTVSYPFTEDPAILPDNKGQVIKIGEKEEKKLIKTGLLEPFNREFDKMLRHGAMVELSGPQLKMWKGPKHYVSLQHVLNDDSATTPFRIVTNSSLSNRNGVSVNSILMKGPNSLSDQWSVLNQWRAYEVALCSDVTKAYYSLRTGEVEKHIRRVVWRYGDQESEWRIFAFCTVSFGDKPAAAFLEIAIKKIAEMNKHIDPLAAYRIVNDRYVDDFASGGTPSQVARFVGNEQDDFQCDGTFPTILSKGGLRLKVLVASGETNQEKIAKLGGKVLGLGYNPTTDIINIDCNVTLKVNNNDKMTLSDIDLNAIDHDILTPQNMLGVVNGIYDPHGLIAPITTRSHVAFREIFQEESPIQWESPISSDTIRSNWIHLLRLLVEAGTITFRRATKPLNAVGKCILVGFFDGSDVAYAAAIYIRWILDDGSVFVTLVCAKSKVTPLHRISTPRSELNGAVVAARLMSSTVQSLSSADIVPERAWMIGDSECTLASLEKVNAAFGEYFGNRIGEIVDLQSKIEQFCPVGNDGEWWHTDSHHNAADRATRLDSVGEDVAYGSEWQCGPAYLKQATSEWPINRDFAQRREECIPQNELLKRFRCIIQKAQIDPVPGIDQLIDSQCTNDWEYLLYKTQLLVYAFHTQQYPSFDDVSTIEAAKRLWFLSAMPATEEASKQGKLRELDIREINGLKVVCGRASTGMQKFLGKSSLPVIMGSTRVAYLVMLHAHCKDHTGRDVTMAMSRLDAWIVNAKKLARQIVKNCIRCRFLRKQLEGQKMAPLPPNIQSPCPPWTNIGLDLCGPITVRSMTNKRSSMKVWVVIFLCLNTKAVSMELAPGYSTEDFLLAYDNQVHVRGSPRFVHSDRGSQLVAAHKDVADELLKYDWDLIASSTSTNGTTWKFAPAGGQWRNGAAESFVKKFKRSFYHLYRETKFNFAELACAVKRIANILNNRPISVQRTKSDAQDDEFLSPLTPNMLITGRSGDDAPRDYIDTVNPQIRSSFIEELEEAWWYQYKVQYFDSLIPTRKWIDSKRNMTVGDVVLIMYTSKSSPGTYRLGRVSSVELDDDELVRTCTVRYNLIKPVNANNRNSLQGVVPKEVRVPVQRLVLILPTEEQ